MQSRPVNRQRSALSTLTVVLQDLGTGKEILNLRTASSGNRRRHGTCLHRKYRSSMNLEKAVNRRWTPINADRTRRYVSGNVHPTGASASGRNPINLFGVLAFIGVHLRFQGSLLSRRLPGTCAR